ncbi:MAG TPA: hypothetical protein VNV65_03305 [Candidatus Solibacter sp.]|nr:hypothetical protein [Candidatus Solibacter sp.]
MNAIQQAAAHNLAQDLRARGWHVAMGWGGIRAKKEGWPVQLHAVAQFGDEEDASVLALVIDMSSMPMGGDRFRDVFNADRDDLLRGLGHFRVRQLLKNGEWAAEMGERAFFGGANAGIRVTARLVMFDLCPSETGFELGNRFLAESNRIVACGNLVGATLARIYQARVLGAPVQPLELPAVVPKVLAPLNQVIEPSYPWRR